MGRILKAKTPGATSLPTTVEASATNDTAALVLELLVAARAAAEAERLAAKDAALLLARKMAEKIIGHAIEMDPGIAGAIATQALVASRPRTGPIVLRVHPEDRHAVEAARLRWPSDIAALDLQIVNDASVRRAGCFVDTPVGRLDGRLTTQLDSLERALRPARRSS